MALDKLVDSTQLDTDLTSVADAIRTKGGTSAQLAFPSDFVSAINAISGGGGGVEPDWSTITEVTIGANSVTNTSAAKTFFSGYESYAVLLLKETPTTNNQLVGIWMSGINAARLKNGSIASAPIATVYDCVLTEGTHYYVLGY